MVRENSVASLGSHRSTAGKYHVVSKGSFVDESLFGSKPGTPSKATQQKDTQQPGKRISATKAGSLKAATRQEVITLTHDDLHRMLKDASVMSAEEKASLRHEAEAAREQERAAAKARKEKMLRLAEEAKKQAPSSESELVKQQADNGTLSHANHLLEEQLDLVKHMNQMVQYAKCVAVRDKQVKDKVEAMLADEEQQRRLDMEMEVERLRALDAYANRDVQRRQEQRRGAEILREQLAERQRQRDREEELKDMERMQMLRELERLKEEEAAAAVAKRQRAAALMQEVAAANSEQIQRKEALKQREREDHERVAEYIRLKDMREQELAAEKERVAHEKEMETARLRAMQEKQADHQSEVDELRARRYQEAKDREWRAKERAAAERQAAMMADLRAAREAQTRGKLRLQADMAALEQAEFRRVLDVNQQKEAEEMSQAMAQHEINEAYKRDLMAQIQATRERERSQRADSLEAGRRLKEQQARERAQLEAVKTRKLAELAAQGVPGKYQAELQRLKVASAGKH